MDYHSFIKDLIYWNSHIKSLNLVVDTWIVKVFANHKRIGYITHLYPDIKIILSKFTSKEK